MAECRRSPSLFRQVRVGKTRSPPGRPAVLPPSLSSWGCRASLLHHCQIEGAQWYLPFPHPGRAGGSPERPQHPHPVHLTGGSPLWPEVSKVSGVPAPSPTVSFPTQELSQHFCSQDNQQRGWGAPSAHGPAVHSLTSHPHKGGGQGWGEWRWGAICTAQASHVQPKPSLRGGQHQPARPGPQL